MKIDKRKVRTLEETHEEAPIDEVNERVEAEMKLIESEAKQQVAQGLGDKKLALDAERLKQEAEKELKRTRK